MGRCVPTVVLMCGLPGSGKSTYAQRYVDAGYARLSLDEAIWQRLDGRDAGRVLEPDEFDALKVEVRLEQRRELADLMASGRDVVVDYTFWSRARRDDYKALIEARGGQWRLVYLAADRDTLAQRIAARNADVGANSVTLSPELFEQYLDRFEEPHGEGEEVVPA